MSVLEITENQEKVVVLNGESEIKIAAGVEVSLVARDSISNRSFRIERDAKVKLLRCRDFSSFEAPDNMEIFVDGGATMETTAVYLGNNQSQVNIMGHVKDVAGRSDLNVLYFADQPSSLDLKIRNEFYQRDGQGDIVVKGVAAKKSRVTVFGEIGIQQTAGGTDSSLDAHALIVGKGVKVRQLPILEINTNDVKAAHGATVSRLQDEELFYFMSRGIPRDVAYNLAVNGFLASLICDMDDFGEYQAEILEALAAKTKSLVE